MKFCKALFLVIFLLIFAACTSNDDIDYTPPELTITTFSPSKQEVEITWELSKGADVIIEDLLVYRETRTDDSDRTYFELIESLPSSAKSYTDLEVPYTPKISYIIKANYRLNNEGGPYETIQIESEPQVFSRLFPTFNNVPFQVTKDSNNDNVYHILERGSMVNLKRYDGALNRIIQKIEVSNRNEYRNKFHLTGNQIMVADIVGNILTIDKDSYKIINEYKVEIKEDLTAFVSLGDKIYYQDDVSFLYYNIDSNTSIRTGYVYQFDHLEPLPNNRFLSIYGGFRGGRATIYEAEIDGDPINPNDTRLNIIDDTYPEQSFDLYGTDPNNMVWNNDRTKFITTIAGRIFSINDLKLPTTTLKQITGKNYFYFAFSENGDIYASVQKEKVIHVFDGTTLELKEEISTKLFPLFPLFTESGLACIGTYERVEYYHYGHGNEFYFNKKSALENF